MSTEAVAMLSLGYALLALGMSGCGGGDAMTDERWGEEDM
jgi:hypothetical protein